jgi:membrane protease YdiL (CAAX protease family)
VEVVLGVLALALGAALVGGVALWLAGRGGEIHLALAAWITSSLLGLVMLPVVWGLGPRRWRGLLPALGLTAPRQRWPKAAAMTVGVLIASLAATALYGWALDRWGWPSLKPPDIPREVVFPGVAAVLSFQALAVWTPITEEIFFRGFVFGGLVARWGAVGAIVASALVFSAFHLAPGVLLPVFVTGLLLAWLYHRTGSLWPCMAAHAGQNAIALAATLYGV